MAEREPVVLNGRYELHKRIARGGMADVVLARDQLLERPVAVKILFAEFATDTSFVERFRREAQAAAGLNHPNIVGVYDWGRESNTYFIVMEYVDGRSLADLLRNEGTLHPDRAADIATDVAAALGFAHRNGVVHRDIKPGNVLISSSGLVKVTDFGIARAVSHNAEEALTQTGSVMGTATYFSPEQAQGKAVDPRSDLYSLGVVMYEMVCGSAPFQAENPVAVAYKHVQEQVVPPSQIDPSIPASYEAITMRLLAKNPDARYASAEELRSDLRRFRQGEQIQGAADATQAVGVAAATTMMAAGAATPPRGTQVMGTNEHYDAEPARRRTRRFVIGTVVSLLVVALLVFFAYRLLGAGGDDEVVVPDVAGQTVSQAMARLSEAGLVPVSRGVASAEVPRNHVIRTDPPEGTEMTKGEEIIVFFVNETPTSMPEVLGLTLEDARARLGNIGVDPDRITVRRTYDDDCEVGKVTRSDPVPTSEISSTTEVTLWVCAGAESTVPEIGPGTPVDEAERVLRDAGYSTTQEYRNSNDVESGLVIGTEPSSGSRLAEGETVTILVSSGPAPTTPPPTTAPPSTEAPTTPPPTQPPPTSPPTTTPPTTTPADAP